MLNSKTTLGKCCHPPYRWQHISQSQFFLFKQSLFTTVRWQMDLPESSVSQAGIKFMTHDSWLMTSTISAGPSWAPFRSPGGIASFQQQWLRWAPRDQSLRPPAKRCNAPCHFMWIRSIFWNQRYQRSVFADSIVVPSVQLRACTTSFCTSETSELMHSSWSGNLHIAG